MKQIQSDLEKSSVVSSPPLLECKSLTKQYVNKVALSGVNLVLERGKIIGLLGPNGSGKTTLIKLINGLLAPSAGEVKIAGHLPGVASKEIVAYLPERNALSEWMKISELINFFNDFYRDFQREKAMEMLSHLKLDPEQRLKTLSKGNREKVQLVLVMSRNAELYILDEPIGGVDPASRDYILNTIISNYSENASVLISTHLIADIEPVLDEFIFLQNGEIVLHRGVDEMREVEGKSVDMLFREVFKC